VLEDTELNQKKLQDWVEGIDSGKIVSGNKISSAVIAV
jgi:hypothetical protein